MITLLSNWMLLKNMRILPFLLLPAICLAQDPGPSVEVQRDYNSLIVAQVKRIPEGGTYAANKLAIVRLRSAGHFESGKFFTIPKTPFPSFCSGATYLVFVRTLEELRRQGKLTYKFDTVNALVIRGQRDGEGIWGRWNANGPGTARLFHELKLGRNFTEYSQAKPGDFMKIFWTKEVGKLERGHSVIYMGSSKLDGADHVTFQQPAGRLRHKDDSKEQDRSRHLLPPGKPGESQQHHRNPRFRSLSRQPA
jgi:hypothetical protein